MRRAHFRRIESHIHKQEKKFGEGEEAKRWMLEDIGKVRVRSSKKPKDLEMHSVGESEGTAAGEKEAADLGIRREDVFEIC